MAKDDMLLLAYKILRYLYGCNRRGKTPTFSDLYRALELPGVPVSYLARILESLTGSGYISGCSVTVTKDATVITVSENAGLTLDGAAYLTENGRMQQAARAAGRVFEIVLEGVLAAAAAHV